MAKLGIYPKITKKYILDRISQEDIMEKFLNIPVNYETQQPNSISSPFRIDKNPSCNYWYNSNGKLRIKDWSSNDVNYDCFDVVARYLRVESKHPESFMLILHEIAKTFKINKYVEDEEVRKFELYKRDLNSRKKVIKQRVVYKVILRKPNYHDISYWKKYELDIKDLRGVYFIQEIYMLRRFETKLIYRYSPKDACYGYYGRKVDNIDLWKFYFPFRKKRKDRRGSKFITNGNFVQGIQYLQPDKICVLTKSYKDALVFKKLKIQSCALSAETIIPSKKDINNLKMNFDFIITCFDWDRTGIVMANKLSKKHNFIPYMFTKGYFNSIDYKAKDASDFVEENGLFTLKTIINKEYSKNKKEIDAYLKAINKNLNFI